MPEFPQEWRDATLAAICDTRPPDGWSGGDEHNRARAIAVLAALAEVGALPPPYGEPDLWQYAHRDADEPDGLMELDGTPRVITARTLRRPMRAIGPWQGAPDA